MTDFKKLAKRLCSVSLAASMVTTCAAISTLSVSAITRASELDSHTMGICGTFTDWSPGKDIPMNDDDGDGVWEGVVDLESVNESWIADYTFDGAPTGEKYLQCKIRLDSDWFDDWGTYEPTYVRTWGSQTNIAIKEDFKAGDHIRFTVYLDTTQMDPDCVADPEAGMDPVEDLDYYLWKVGYKNFEVNPQFDWREEYDNDIIITKYIGNSSDVVIPSEIVGKPVTGIDDGTFEGCTNVTSVTIPDSVTYIDNKAFEDCTGLTSVTIPDSVTHIGELAFRGCTGLTSINVDKNNEEYTSENGVLFKKDKSVLEIYPEGKKGAYIIPDSVTYIGGHAFHHCTGLTNVTIPDSVTEIRNFAFLDCTGLTSVTIPGSVTDICSYAFYGCSALTSVELSEGISSIGNFAFTGCTSLTSVKIPQSVTEMGHDAFGYYRDDAGIIIDGFTIIGYPGSAAETYAKENDFDFVPVGQESSIPDNTESKRLTDETTNISVEGAVPEGVRFSTKALPIDKEKEPNVIWKYDIKFLDSNNQAVQPNGKITISVPCDVPDGNVFWFDDTGIKTYIPSTYKDGFVVFTIDHLSVYQLETKNSSVIEDSEQQSGNQTGNTSGGQSSGGSNNTANNQSSGGTNNIPDNTPADNNTNTNSNTNTNTDVPQTGDNGIMFVLAAFAAMVSGAAITIFKRRKKTEK